MPSAAIRLLAGGDPKAGMEPSGIVSPEQFTGADRTELSHTFFQTPDAAVETGVWLCAPYKAVIESYPVHELMTILEGAVTVTGADGKAETFKTGDTLFIAKGTKCTWEVTETLRKFYMVAV